MKTLMIDDVDYVFSFQKLNGGEVVPGKVAIVPGDTTLKVNSFSLKRDNATLFEALKNPSTDGLGSSTVSNGNNTITYSQVYVVTGFKQIGNPSEFNEVVLKFVK